MATAIWVLLFFGVFLGLTLFRRNLYEYLAGFGLYLLLLSSLSSTHPALLTFYWIAYVAIFAPLVLIPWRRHVISRFLFQRLKRNMPTLSQTEREALTSGTVGWTAELMGGKPNWQRFSAMTSTVLSQEEQAFLAGPVEALCEMINNWEISRTMQIPEAIWSHLKQSGFFGMIIPKAYGGMGFSAMAHSQVIVTVSGVSTAVATVIGVPNSLGPAELLLEYGTQEQKSYYLPRLAKGEEIPCFALTSPRAGSDASAITDHGVVCEAVFEGKQQLCIRLNWDKRYITLAPVATLLGLAFRLYDPEHLLGDQEAVGITCALIPTSTPGVVHGRRHYPLDCAFPNGPTQGKDVLIPIDWVIGGQARVGQGWKMLMECLAAGRSVTLPSMVVGGMKRTALATGAYARIRRQFNTPIGQFGGVEEALARIAAYTYLGDATREFTVSALDQGSTPVVASAISKCHVTTLSRQVTNDAMDVHGGKAICMGPNNYLAQGYIECPIGITVEGANILTRSMIIFGQGVIRCHPYALAEIMAMQTTDTAEGLKAFDKAFFGHAGFLLSNVFRSICLGLTQGRGSWIKPGPLKKYYQRMTRYSAVLALVSDVSLIFLGARLKREEKISARLGDLLSYLYMGCAVLKYYETKSSEEELPVVAWLLQDAFYQFEKQLCAFLHNFPHRWIARVLRLCTLPLGARMQPPADRLGAKVAALLIAPSELRKRYGRYTYLTRHPDNLIGEMEMILRQVIAMEPLEQRVMTALRNQEIKGKCFAEWVSAAKAHGILNAEEADDLIAMDEARMRVIAVDDFDLDSNASVQTEKHWTTFSSKNPLHQAQIRES